MSDVDRDVSIHLNLDTTGAEAGFRRVKTQADQFGQALNAAGNGAGPAMARLNQQMTEMGLRFQQTGLISTRALATVGVQIRTLTDEYGKTAGAVDKLSASERQFLTAAQGAYKEAIARQKEFNEQMHLVQAQTGEWTGFQNALKAVAGSYAELVGNVFAVAVAFKAGWDVGEKFGKFMEEHVSAWSRSWDELASHITNAQVAMTRLTDDPRFKGTRTEQLLPQIIAQMAHGQQAYEAAGMKLVDYGETLVRAYYQNNLKLYEENKRKALAAQEDYIKRSNELWSKQSGGFAAYQQQFGVSSQGMFTLSMQDSAKIVDDLINKGFATNVAIEKLKWAEQRKRDQEMADEMKKDAEAMAEAITSAFKESGTFISDVLVDFSQTGGKNFGAMLQNYIAKGASQGIQQLFSANGPLASVFSGAFGPKGLDVSGYWNAQAGAYIDPQTGKAFQGDTPQQQQLQAQAQALNKYISGSLQAAGAIYNSLTNGSTASLGGFAQDAVSYAGIGAQMGGVIGGVIGVIVAGIVQAFKPSMVEVADYAQYNVRGGAAHYIQPQAGFEGSDIQQRKVQETFNQAFNAFTSVILRFPAEVLSKLIIPATALNVSGGKWDMAAGGLITGYGKQDFQKALQDFNAWLADTLPEQVAEAFKPALEQGFKALGLTNTAFEKYWETMKGVDPQKAQEFWSNLVDFLNTWNDVQTSMANINKATAGNVAGWNLNPDGSQRIAGQSDYMQSLSQAEEKIRDLSAAVATLTGPDQIAEAKAMGQSLNDVMSSLNSYLNLIGTTAKAISEDIHSRLLSLDLDQAKNDKQKQQDILYAEYKRLLDQIQNASKLGLSPDQLKAYESQAADIAGQIYGLAPDSAHADWYRRQLDQIQKISDAQLQQMADTAKTEVEKLIAQVKPFVDYINGIPDSLDPAFAAAETSLVSFSDALDLLSGRITNDINTSPGGSEGSHPRNWVWDPTTGKWVPPGTIPDDAPVTTAAQRVTAAPGGVIGELRIYVDDTPAGTVDLRSDGFARRTAIARVRR